MLFFRIVLNKLFNSRFCGLTAVQRNLYAKVIPKVNVIFISKNSIGYE